ncbi:TRAP transporter small permease [Breoghania sp. L-A4]|uniref:TRAP transporter small permease subunit n=1 Tax=Breoghania sp. L-A4 TaxID=2304600 RepID=UPI000E35CF39|nr:TRAP transporter small permease [Breoghania sp. L-A4]AXS41525.1 TRAP transporter small permease [Breoghania sp. L-A4]
MNLFTRAVSWAFGLLLIGLSIFVSLETVSRKLFNFSFQGADELGGYILAICGSLAFTVALIERGHVRIDFLHDRLPEPFQAVLNWFSALFMALLGLFFARYGYGVIRDTLDYGSTAPTPWATPLIYPQSLWYAALVIFFLVSLGLLAGATWNIARGRFGVVNRLNGPKGAMEELSEELSDFRNR